MKTTYKYEGNRMKGWSLVTALAGAAIVYFSVPSILQKLGDLREISNNLQTHAHQRTSDLKNPLYLTSNKFEYDRRK
jgi:hypothetical protein